PDGQDLAVSRGVVRHALLGGPGALDPLAGAGRAEDLAWRYGPDGGDGRSRRGGAGGGRGVPAAAQDGPQAGEGIQWRRVRIARAVGSRLRGTATVRPSARARRATRARRRRPPSSARPRARRRW